MWLGRTVVRVWWGGSVSWYGGAVVVRVVTAWAGVGCRTVVRAGGGGGGAGGADGGELMQHPSHTLGSRQRSAWVELASEHSR